ncbi:MAG: hypothetical protein M1836_004538 [Candelina mexicana]|nr:MAG: hypothetical protein M1836_004538 [Candelina mexicana]
MRLQALLAFSLLPSTHATISTITLTSSLPPPTPTSPTYISTSAFQLAVIAAHNLYRTQHNASALNWNTTLATYASQHAQNCQFKHSGGPYGENLAAGYPNATSSVAAWGDERALYNFLHQGFSEATGHFTQVVWKGTRDVGCGRVDCGGRNEVPGWYVVCEYYPPGNVEGGYVQNVQKAVKGAKGYIQGGVNGGGMVRRGSWVMVLLGAGMVLTFF